ncbi:SCO family protein [Hyphomicrobium sp.]|uniref:SCO family protein n=1 Tax=Hyphomicrobium sp. TaxID=82 RepID=UPI002E325641|nr:SCO family protein [Hyphomicrobium sp.]HEX2841262.1 SCO family protein [Hyphomicrobium sp.]
MLHLSNVWQFLLRRSRRVQAGCVLISLFASSVSVTGNEQGIAGPLHPKAGTYKLHKIQPATSGWVLEDSVWIPHRLSSYTKGKITLFSFFYGTCRDPEGCPKAWDAFYAVHDAVKKNPALHNKVRLVFLSLDPKADTPEQMSFFKGSISTPEAPWSFLTTWSESYLAPILNDMYVPASREFDEAGKPTDVINHLVKVFLIDKESWVREIYTTNFLDSDVILADIGTLLLEEE